MKLNDIDLNKLHVFRAVAESASMREAGEKLLRTPSAVSQSVAGLEKSLGLKLFLRRGIRLELTDSGRRLLEQVKTNERGLSALLDDLRGTPALVRGRVTVGMPPGYPAVSLADGMSSALLAHPALQLRLRFLSHVALAEGLVDGDLQMALSLQPLRRWNRSIKSIELREENLVLAVPPQFRRLCNGAPTELPVVDYYQKPLLIDGWLKHHRQGKVKTPIRVYAANLDHVLQMVARGVGCAVVPRHVVAAELTAGTLFEHSWDRRRPWMVSVWLNAVAKPEDMTRGARALWAALHA